MSYDLFYCRDKTTAQFLLPAIRGKTGEANPKSVRTQNLPQSNRSHKPFFYHLFAPFLFYRVHRRKPRLYALYAKRGSDENTTILLPLLDCLQTRALLYPHPHYDE